MRLSTLFAVFFYTASISALPHGQSSSLNNDISSHSFQKRRIESEHVYHKRDESLASSSPALTPLQKKLALEILAKYVQSIPPGGASNINPGLNDVANSGMSNGGAGSISKRLQLTPQQMMMANMILAKYIQSRPSGNALVLKPSAGPLPTLSSDKSASASPKPSPSADKGDSSDAPAPGGPVFGADNESSNSDSAPANKDDNSDAPAPGGPVFGADNENSNSDSAPANKDDNSDAPAPGGPVFGADNESSSSDSALESSADSDGLKENEETTTEINIPSPTPDAGNISDNSSSDADAAPQPSPSPDSNNDKAPSSDELTELKDAELELDIH